MTPDGLGDGYRVEARVVSWESASVSKVSVSALFRVKQGWNLFAVENGRAQLVSVEVGHRNASEAEILGGLNEGGQVILHPANELKAGVRVAAKGE